MNHIYRLVFNRSLGVMQAVSEVARSRAGKSSSGGSKGASARVLAAGFGVGLLLVSGAALADVNGGTRSGTAGTGGAGSYAGGGGAGGAGSGYSAPWILPGANGAGSAGMNALGGAAGGAGGAVGLTMTSNTTLTTSVTGGAGANAVATGAGGGGGGTAVYIDVPGDAAGITIGPVLTGGHGGNGTAGGGGGGGGAGLMIASTTWANTFATITGGTGGTGGTNAGGGGGGAGIYLPGSAMVYQYGSVTGGVGGAGGTNGGKGSAGAGITAENGGNTVINYGTITGGSNGSAARADAIDFSGGNNRLILVAGSSIVGNVVATGTGNSLALSGGTTGTSTNNFSGFSTLSNDPNTNWTISGAFTRTTDTLASIYTNTTVTLTQPFYGSQALTMTGGGTLAIDASNGYTGNTTISQGTLKSTLDFVSTGTLTNNSTFDMNGNWLLVGNLSGSASNATIANAASIHVTETGSSVYAGALSSAGALAMSGTGTLILTGTATSAFVTLLDSSTLQIGNGGTSGTLASSLAQGFGSDGTLAFDRSDDVAYASDIVGLHVTQAGSGALTLTGDNTIDQVNVTGGTLRLGTLSGLGTADVNLSNGTRFDFGSVDASLANSFALSGTSTFNVADGVTGTLTGRVSNATSSANLTKTGSGTLVVDGNGAYTGVTDVAAGTLVVGSSTAAPASLSGSATVDAGATLGGFGKIAGTVTVAGGTLSPGMSDIGTLSIGNLTVDQGHLAMDLGAPGTSDLIAVNGNASFNGAVVDVTDTGDMGLGVYRILDVSGDVTNSDLTLGSTPAGSRLALRYLSADHAYDVLNIGDLTLNYWNANGLASSAQAGGGSGTWSLTSPVFSDATGSVTSSMYPTPGFAVFGGAAGTVNVSSTDGNVSANGLQFMTDGYTMVGDALDLVADNGDTPVIRVGDGTSQGAATTATIDNVLTGTDGLRKTDAGTLVLNGQNTFSGGVTVDGGTLAVTSDANLGDASNTVTLDGGTLTNAQSFTTARDVVLGAAGGTLDTNGSGLYLAGTVSGTGTLTKTGQGGLALMGDDTYTGGTVISGGILAVGYGGTTGSITGNVSGAANSILAFYRSDDIDFAGNIDGVTVAKLGAGTLTLSGTNTAPEFDIYQGTLRLGSTNALGSASVTLLGGAAFDFGATSVSLGNTFNLVSDNTFNVADGVTGRLTGDLPDTGSLASITKTGSGTLVIDGNANYSGPTTIEGGTLVVGSTAGNGASLSGQVEVEQGTTLGGNGVALAQVTVDGGTIAPGMDQAGTLTVGSLVMHDGHLAIGLGANGASDSLDVMGDAQFNDSTLDITDLGSMGVGVYRVVNVGGNVLSAGLSLGDTPDGSRLSLRYLSDEHAFDVASLGNLTLNYWNANGLASATQAGGGTGIWSNTSLTFTDVTGAVTDAMYPQPGFAVFGGDAGTVTVQGSNPVMNEQSIMMSVAQATTGVTAQGMQFMTDGYVMNGDALTLVATDGETPVIRVGDGTAASANMTATIDNVLAGTDGLSKTDGGTLVLNADNTWSGGLAIEGGTVAVSRDANLGDASNEVALSGGTLRVTDAFDTDRNITLGGNGGTLALDADLAVSGTVSGDGALHKSGTGTLSLYGANTYTAGTWLDAGTLQIGNDAALGTGTLTMAEGTTLGLLGNDMHVANDIVATGDPTIDVAEGHTSTLSGVISNGTVAGDIVKTGTGTLRLTGENTYTGGTTVADGTLIVGDGSTHGSIVGNVVDNGTLAFDRSDDVTFGGQISGTGTVQKLGGNTLTLTGDSSAFAGDTQIDGGTLAIDGSLGGTLSIAEGATLTGSGKLGTVSIASGSTMTPGGDAAVGTFAVAGNLDIASGSTYVVNTTAAGTSDTVTVAGTATIDGASVKSLQDGGTYLPQSRYTILTATGGVTGTFGDVSSNLAFLTPTLAYDANHVYLDLARNDVSFASLAQTRNQAATAGAVDSQGFGAPVYDAVVGLTSAAVPPALDTLAGASLASARTALINDAREVRDTVQRHVLDADATGTPANGVWTSAWGHWGDTRASGGVARQSSNGSGLLVGADRDLDGVTVGVLGGAGNLTACTGNDSVQSKSTVAGLYAAATAGAWQWQAGATYAWDRLDSHRHIDVAGVAGIASARYDANVGQAYVDAGYRFEFSHGSVSPFVNVARVQVAQDGLTERNTDAALQIRGENDGVTVGTAGLRGALSLGAAVSAHATLGYQHAWGDIRPSDTQRFVSGGDSFTVAGVPVAKNAGLLDTGIAFAVGKNTTVDASYHGVFGGGSKDQGARLGLTVKW